MPNPQLAAQGTMQMFQQVRPSAGALTRTFKPVPGSTGRYVDDMTWDIVRDDNLIAGTLKKYSGSHGNTGQLFTSKAVDFPDYGEHSRINLGELTNRLPGENPFAAADTTFQTRLLQRIRMEMPTLVKKIERSIELQAAQILTTGALALPGDEPFSMSFNAKGTHFPTTGTSWASLSTADPIGDLAALAKVIATDSDKRVTDAIFGCTAALNFINNANVKADSDLARHDTVGVAPTQFDDSGMSFFGRVTIGGYSIRLWQYDRRYTPFGGGAQTPFIPDDKVVLIPNMDVEDHGMVVVSAKEALLGPDPRVAGLFRFPATAAGGFDLTPNAWSDAEGKVLNYGFRTRAILVPQAIDSFGCLDTIP
jgi:hypothetical protein